ncbi:hypothetical protein H0H93_010673 [Arthromyces matolae]|nr:hypothetical protein H0H93_010673 [Arthromyces matolae]
MGEYSKSGLPVDVVKIDTEKQEQAALAQRHEIRALPTVVAFQDGKVVARFTGALNEDGVRRFLQGL